MIDRHVETRLLNKGGDEGVDILFRCLGLLEKPPGQRFTEGFNPSGKSTFADQGVGGEKDHVGVCPSIFYPPDETKLGGSKDRELTSLKVDK